MKSGTNPWSSCESCNNFQYDEDDDCYYCLVDMDQDDCYRFLSGAQFSCPFYRNNDEYEVVRHQI